MSHGTLVLTWLSRMHFHGAYFSNYNLWIKPPAFVTPSSQSIWNVAGQDILNSDVGAYYQGLHLTSGLFTVWRSTGMFHCTQLKLIAITLQIVVTLLLLAAYSHVTGGDFGSTSMTINAWLTNFLWSQASQVLQSYGTSNAGYGLIFLTAHFVWALSLMFLYSGRGYWQELIESILWSHNKLHLSPEIQVRALSITQGRAAVSVSMVSITSTLFKSCISHTLLPL